MLPLPIHPVAAEVFGGLSPTNEVPSPPYLNMKHFKSVEFFQILECQAPLRKRKTSLMKTFCWRFCTNT